MTFKKTIEEIKKWNKVKHKSWDSLIVDSFCSNIVNLTDDRGYPYYFELNEKKLIIIIIFAKKNMFLMKKYKM